MLNPSEQTLPPIVAIVGKSGSGKTTLIEKLLPELKRRGYRIGTIKHHRHPVEIDYEGKDSWRHTRAGAETVVLASPERLSMVKKLEVDMTPEEMRERFFEEMDLVLAEGYKGGVYPKIEVFRTAVHDAPICQNDTMLQAIVSDQNLRIGVPCFGLEDVDALADFLEQRYLKE
jgi:molybdopterin-guanine dinucleotide biosynthesis protein B